MVAANTVVALITAFVGARKIRWPEARHWRRLHPRRFRSLPISASNELADQAGAVATGDGDVRSHFPALSDSIGVAAVKALLATSQIVGMACPGLHSLFAGLAM